MLLLSSLLGPAKPPVASREDVDSALGVHRVQRSGGNLIASAVDGDNNIGIAPGERCLVCLCEYEPDEQVRQLNKCTHLFHRECIDEVRHLRRPQLSWFLLANGAVNSGSQLGATPARFAEGKGWMRSSQRRHQFNHSNLPHI